MTTITAKLKKQWFSLVMWILMQRYTVEPAGIGIWFLAVLVSWVSVIVLILRISRCQAEFRWSDGEQSQRVMMTPLLPGGSPVQRPIQVRQIQKTPDDWAARSRRPGLKDNFPDPPGRHFHQLPVAIGEVKAVVIS